MGVGERGVCCLLIGGRARHFAAARRAPVFRELYSEKRVIEEERRLRVDDAPLGT